MLGLNQVSYQTILNAAVGAGINCLRLTYCDAGMIAEVPPQSADGSNFSINTTENPGLSGLTTLQMVDAVVDYCGQIGLKLWSRPDVAERHRWADDAALQHHDRQRRHHRLGPCERHNPNGIARAAVCQQPNRYRYGAEQRSLQRRRAPSATARLRTFASFGWMPGTRSWLSIQTC